VMSTINRQPKRSGGYDGEALCFCEAKYRTE